MWVSETSIAPSSLPCIKDEQMSCLQVPFLLLLLTWQCCLVSVQQISGSFSGLSLMTFSVLDSTDVPCNVLGLGSSTSEKVSSVEAFLSSLRSLLTKSSSPSESSNVYKPWISSALSLGGGVWDSSFWGFRNKQVKAEQCVGTPSFENRFV